MAQEMIARTDNQGGRKLEDFTQQSKQSDKWRKAEVIFVICITGIYKALKKLNAKNQTKQSKNGHMKRQFSN